MHVVRLRAPIVLVHGLFGYDRLRIAGMTVASYFGNLPEYLAAAGNRVLVARLHPTGGVAQRATELQSFLDRAAPDEPVHILAHSMGGLDARYMISRLAMAHRVLSLTTIGTPHRGTVFADWLVQRVERVLRPLFESTGIPRQAFHDLTTARCRTFNEQVPDAPSVRYFSVAGRHDAHWLSPEWHLPQSIVSREGPNDGVVSVASASYGEACEVWEGDHLSLVNWHNPLVYARLLQERPLHYAALVRRLAEEGF